MSAPSYVQIVKTTAHVVAPKAQEITSVFYRKMLSNNPEVLKYFNKTNQRTGRQSGALADAVIAYAVNIENLGALSGAVELMTHKHCALGVQPEDYAVVHKNLMDAVGEVLKVDGEIASGWSEAVLALAKILIDAEKELYAAAEKRAGGWRGKRQFIVDEVVNEAKDIVSIYFKPKDGKAAPEYTAGQYITLVDNPSKDELFAPRHYTISLPPERAAGRLRITVKKIRRPDPEVDDGLMSSYVHTLKVGDEVQLHPPFGVARIPMPAAAPSGGAAVAIVTAGVGVTTCLPMAAPEMQSARRKVLIAHSDRDAASHALAREQAALGCPCLFAYTADADAADAAAPPPPAHVTLERGGRLTARRLVDFVAAEAGGAGRVDYWLCGPPSFMAAMAHGLVREGVAKDCLHYETFGPNMDLCPGAG